MLCCPRIELAPNSGPGEFVVSVHLGAGQREDDVDGEHREIEIAVVLSSAQIAFPSTAAAPDGSAYFGTARLIVGQISEPLVVSGALLKEPGAPEIEVTAQFFHGTRHSGMVRQSFPSLPAAHGGRVPEAGHLV